MPLSEVQAGMKCTAYSVFHGQQIETFDVDIVDIVGQAANFETAPRLLVRVSGPKVDETGVGPGFSGSPILCPDGDGDAGQRRARSRRRSASTAATRCWRRRSSRSSATPVDAPAAEAALAARAVAARPLDPAPREADLDAAHGRRAQPRADVAADRGRRAQGARRAGRAVGPRRLGAGAAVRARLGDGRRPVQRRHQPGRDRHRRLHRRRHGVVLRPQLRRRSARAGCCCRTPTSPRSSTTPCRSRATRPTSCRAPLARSRDAHRRRLQRRRRAHRRAAADRSRVDVLAFDDDRGHSAETKVKVADETDVGNPAGHLAARLRRAARDQPGRDGHPRRRAAAARRADVHEDDAARAQGAACASATATSSDGVTQRRDARAPTRWRSVAGLDASIALVATSTSTRASRRPHHRDVRAHHPDPRAAPGLPALGDAAQARAPRRDRPGDDHRPGRARRAQDVHLRLEAAAQARPRQAQDPAARRGPRLRASASSTTSSSTCPARATTTSSTARARARSGAGQGVQGDPPLRRHPPAVGPALLPRRDVPHRRRGAARRIRILNGASPGRSRRAAARCGPARGRRRGGRTRPAGGSARASGARRRGGRPPSAGSTGLMRMTGRS